MGNKRSWIHVALGLLLLLWITACTGGTAQEAVPEPKPQTQTEEQSEPKEEAPVKTFPEDPVELLVATPWGEDYFNSRIGNYMKEKLPHIQVKHVDWNGTVENMQELNASQIVPDIVLAFSGQEPLEELEMVYPLDDMVKDYGVDLSQIDPAILAQVRSRDQQGLGWSAFRRRWASSAFITTRKFSICSGLNILRII